MMLTYSVELTPDDNDTLLVTCSDIPELTSVGDDEDEALLNARDALESALELYQETRRPIPLPSPPAEGGFTVTLPAALSLKVLLHNEMLKQGVRKAELARRLDWRLPQVERLLNLNHAARLDHLERAARVLGKQVDVQMV
jgi:antitoxin HicB